MDQCVDDAVDDGHYVDCKKAPATHHRFADLMNTALERLNSSFVELEP